MLKPGRLPLPRRRSLARWDPESPPEWYTPAAQRSRVEAMLMKHHNGEVWPGVVLADDVVIGR